MKLLLDSPQSVVVKTIYHSSYSEAVWVLAADQH